MFPCAHHGCSADVAPESMLFRMLYTTTPPLRPSRCTVSHVLCYQHEVSHCHISFNSFTASTSPLLLPVSTDFTLAQMTVFRHSRNRATRRHHRLPAELPGAYPTAPRIPSLCRHAFATHYTSSTAMTISWDMLSYTQRTSIRNYASLIRLPSPLPRTRQS